MIPFVRRDVPRHRLERRGRRVQPRRRPRRVQPSPAPAPATEARTGPRISPRLRGLALWGLGLLGIAGLLAGPVQRGLAAQPAFAIRVVTVTGEEGASEAVLLELAGIEPGSSWLALDRREIERRLERDPWVRRARVHRPWPGRVRLAIDEFEPVARLEIARRIYGVCAGLQVVPAAGEALPLIRTRAGKPIDPDTLGRGLAYLAALRKIGLLPRERVELELADSGGDRLALPDRGFAALVDAAIPASLAVKNVAAFLERLDGEGGSRGTLRLVSGGTAVWRAATSRTGRAG